MAEPFSIVVGCGSLLGSITKLSTQLYSFIATAREARRDLDAVSSELNSLGFCLEALRADPAVISNRISTSLEKKLHSILLECVVVVQEMQQMLTDLSSERFGSKLKWAVHGHDGMDKLRSRLEAHKASLDIALDFALITLTSAVKDDTSSIRRGVREVRADAAQLVQAINQLSDLPLVLEEFATLRRLISELGVKAPEPSAALQHLTEADIKSSKDAASRLLRDSVLLDGIDIDLAHADHSKSAGYLTTTDRDESATLDQGRPSAGSSSPISDVRDGASRIAFTKQIGGSLSGKGQILSGGDKVSHDHLVDLGSSLSPYSTSQRPPIDDTRLLGAFDFDDSEEPQLRLSTSYGNLFSVGRPQGGVAHSIQNPPRAPYMQSGNRIYSQASDLHNYSRYGDGADDLPDDDDYYNGEGLLSTNARPPNNRVNVVDKKAPGQSPIDSGNFPPEDNNQKASLGKQEAKKERGLFKYFRGNQSASTYDGVSKVYRYGPVKELPKPLDSTKNTPLHLKSQIHVTSDGSTGREIHNEYSRDDHESAASQLREQCYDGDFYSTTPLQVPKPAQGNGDRGRGTISPSDRLQQSKPESTEIYEPMYYKGKLDSKFLRNRSPIRWA